MTAGEGGIVTTDDAGTRRASCAGCAPTARASATSSVELGYNYRLTGHRGGARRWRSWRTCAAHTQRAGATPRTSATTCRASWCPAGAASEPAQHVWHQYTVRVPEGRDELREHLRANAASRRRSTTRSRCPARRCTATSATTTAPYPVARAPGARGAVAAGAPRAQRTPTSSRSSTAVNAWTAAHTGEQLERRGVVTRGAGGRRRRPGLRREPRARAGRDAGRAPGRRLRPRRAAPRTPRRRVARAAYTDYETMLRGERWTPSSWRCRRGCTCRVALRGNRGGLRRAGREAAGAVADDEGRALVAGGRGGGRAADAGHIERFNPAVQELRARAGRRGGRVLQLTARRTAPDRACARRTSTWCTTAPCTTST